ncbi:FtsW/RodA/SpoVE family cell cycle protein [Corynebacterium sp.]|uniref:FtsW/RodA/SpoVE family cell cycle protein n=1 Tax=Corynebacterium sp. TaxID=1720 RepID=UPI0026DC4EDA|nr:putative peptidoglycan glycosyltransferase FtsW [Corynebacterium sp.]MDO5031389.1 putative peptidoglycan glycosyltransferase FtsW [Corynebacterium sp.]
MTVTSSQQRPPSTGRGLRGLRAQFSSQPGFDYQMLRIVIFSLVGIGVLMAFSSSMATSVTESQNPWSAAIRQCILVALGLVVFWLGLRIPPATLRKFIPWFLLLSILLLIAVLIPGVGTGRAEVGSQSWISVGGFSFQPSEIARVAVGLYGASALADKSHKKNTISDPFIMYSLIAGFMLLLIVLQGDAGMAASFAIMVVFTLYFAGVDWRVPAVILGLGAVGMVAVFLGGGFRSDRFHTYFDALRGNITDTQDTGFQAYQGFLSLADGGFWGVGLGQSRAKWFYLPEAKNDFIFAIIGEELGLWGGALVIGLFAVLGYVGLRTAKRAQNQYQSLMAATLTVGVVVQAFINIGYVIGVLPVTGIQLPMISAGGTAAIITIGSMGLLCNVARHEPMQISAMQSYGRPVFDRIFFIPEPQAPGEKSTRRSGRHQRRVQGSARGEREGRSRREARFGQAVTTRAPRQEEPREPGQRRRAGQAGQYGRGQQQGRRRGRGERR